MCEAPGPPSAAFLSGRGGRVVACSSVCRSLPDGPRPRWLSRPKSGAGLDSHRSGGAEPPRQARLTLYGLPPRSTKPESTEACLRRAFGREDPVDFGQADERKFCPHRSEPPGPAGQAPMAGRTTVWVCSGPCPTATSSRRRVNRAPPPGRHGSTQEPRGRTGVCPCSAEMPVTAACRPRVGASSRPRTVTPAKLWIPTEWKEMRT